MTPEEFNHMNKSYPFLTYLNFQDEDLIGIIQNMDNQIVSIYVYNYLHNSDEKEHFLKLGKLWWNDSNQQIPINIFLREEFDIFSKILRCFSRKNVDTIIGHTVSLEENFQKRIKKRRIQLVRDMDNKK